MKKLYNTLSESFYLACKNKLIYEVFDIRYCDSIICACSDCPHKLLVAIPFYSGNYIRMRDETKEYCFRTGHWRDLTETEKEELLSKRKE